MNKINHLHVILPHRGVFAAKSRLAAVLDAGARTALNRWLLERTLDVAARWLGAASRCVVVSPCAETLAQARDMGATALNETRADLNLAVAQGAAHAAAQGAQRVVILPCDLPRLDVAALQALAAAAGGGAEVIAPDRHGSGTNALLVAARMREFAFGAGSCARHAALIAARGARVVLCERAELAFDLDTAEDYHAWLGAADATAQAFQTRLIQPGSASTRRTQATTEG